MQDQISRALPPFSGPVTVPFANESAAIRTAPAYDKAAAASFIKGMPEIRAMADNLPEDEELTAFGAAVPSAESFRNLENELKKLTAGRHKVSLLMIDLASRSGVSFRSRVSMCSQSTVKAIYAGALITCRPEALEENGQYLRDAVVFSDNRSYENLRKIYGPRPIEKWCLETGVDPDFAKTDYPRGGTARDMFKLWTRLYCFLNDGSDRTNFGAYFADSAESAAKERLGGRYPLQTKAGWEMGLDEGRDYDPDAEIPARFTDGDPANDECAINDTGVVYTPGGPYIFMIYTDHPFGVFPNYTTPNPLYGIIEALLEVRQSLRRERS